MKHPESILQRANKYGAKKTKLDGITFDSKAESRYFAELKVREKLGEVADVKLQEPFLLQAPNGELIGTYRADFSFHDSIAKRRRVVDVKGFDTPLSAWKRKHVKAQYGIDVEIVR